MEKGWAATKGDDEERGAGVGDGREELKTEEAEKGWRRKEDLPEEGGAREANERLEAVTAEKEEVKRAVRRPIESDAEAATHLLGLRALIGALRRFPLIGEREETVGVE